MPVNIQQTKMIPTDVSEEINDSICFFGGAGSKTYNINDGNGNVTNVNMVRDYQFRYMNKYYPPAKVENGKLDTTMTYLTSLSENDGLMNDYFISRRMSNGERLWEHNFVIIQSFKTFANKQSINGLNTSSTSSPIQLYLNMDTGVTSAMDIVSFVESVHSVRIQQGGATTIVEA